MEKMRKLLEIFNAARDIGSAAGAQIVFAMALYEALSKSNKQVLLFVAYDGDKEYAAVFDRDKHRGIALTMSDVSITGAFHSGEAPTDGDMDIMCAPEFSEILPEDKTRLCEERVLITKLLYDFRVNILDSLYLLSDAANIMKYMIAMGAIKAGDALVSSVLRGVAVPQKPSGDVPLPPCSFDFEPNTRKPYRKEAECCSSR